MEEMGIMLLVLLLLLLGLTITGCLASESTLEEQLKWSSGWKSYGVTMDISDGKVTIQCREPEVGYPNRAYGRIEKEVKVDLSETPVLQVKVDEIDPQVNTTWALMIRDQSDFTAEVLADYVHLVGVWTYNLKDAFKLKDGDPSSKKLLIQLCTAGQGYVTIDSISFLPEKSDDESENKISVDLTRELNTFQGFGGQADSELLSVGVEKDAITQQEYEALMKDVLDLGIRYVRVGVRPTLIEPYNDNRDPHEFDWTFYEKRFASSYFQGVFRHIEYLTERGIEPVVVFWGYPSWLKQANNGVQSISEKMEEDAVELVIAFIFYAIKTRGIPIKYVTFVNEPQWLHNTSGPVQHARIVRRLGERFRELEIDVELFEPDCGWSSSSVFWAKAVLEEAEEYVGPISTHIYDTKVPSFIPQKVNRLQEIVESTAEYPKAHPIWVGEYTAPGIWSGEINQEPYDPEQHMLIDDYAYAFRFAEATQYHLEAGVSGLFLWELYDVLRIGDVQPKRWGAITYKWQGWKKRPLYFAFSMFSKYIPQDSIRVYTSTGKGLLASAFKKDGTVVVVIVNLDDSDKEVQVYIAGMIDEYKVLVYHMSEGKEPYQGDDRLTEREKDSAKCVVGMSGRSISTLVFRNAST